MHSKTYKDFLNGWSVDNKVRAVLFDDRVTSTLRYMAAAFAHRDRVACASVNTARYRPVYTCDHVLVNMCFMTLITAAN